MKPSTISPIQKKYLIRTYQAAVILTTLWIGYLLGVLVIGNNFLLRTQELHRIGWWTVVLVLLIEIGVRIKGGSKKDTLFHIHGVFVILYVVTFCAVLFWYNGHSHPYELWLGYACLISYVGLACVGIPMTATRFS